MQLTCDIFEIIIRSGQYIYQTYVAHAVLTCFEVLRKVASDQIIEIRYWIEEYCQINMNADFGLTGQFCNYSMFSHCILRI